MYMFYSCRICGGKHGQNNRNPAVNSPFVTNLMLNVVGNVSEKCGFRSVVIVDFCCESEQAGADNLWTVIYTFVVELGHEWLCPFELCWHCAIVFPLGKSCKRSVGGVLFAAAMHSIASHLQLIIRQLTVTVSCVSVHLCKNSSADKRAANRIDWIVLLTKFF